MLVSCAETAGPIEMQTHVGPRNLVLAWFISSPERGTFEGDMC